MKTWLGKQTTKPNCPWLNSVLILTPIAVDAESHIEAIKKANYRLLILFPSCK